MMTHLFLGLGLIVIATVTLSYFLWSMLHGIAARQWPIVTGEITSAKVLRQRTRFGSTRHLVVTYTYRVNGLTFAGSRILFGADYLGSKLHPVASERIARYAVGRAIEVRYHPRRHDRAVLEPGITGQTYFGACLTVLVLVIGLVQVARFLK